MEWSEIVAAVLTLALGVGSTYVFVIKGKLGQIKDLVDTLVTGLDDGALTNDEVKDLVAKLKAVFTKQPTGEK